MNSLRSRLRLTLPLLLLAMILTLGLTACRATWDPIPESPAGSTNESSTATETTPESSGETNSESGDASTGKTNDESTDAPSGETSVTEDTSEEETTAPEPKITYTVTVTNACGYRLSGILVTVYVGNDNSQSILNGVTDGDGTYTFDAPEGSYHATAVRTGPASIADTAFFEAGATTLTIALGDHPEYCTCTTEEEGTVAEPTA